MKPEDIIATIKSIDGIHSKAELVMLIENMTQDEFEYFCNEIKQLALGTAMDK